MPWQPSDYISGVGTYPILGDRLRAPLFVKGAGDVDEVSMNDVKQRNLGDCYFMSALAAVARTDPQRIKDMVVDHGDGTYTVTFKQRVGSDPYAQFIDHPITVTGDFPGGVSGRGHAAGGDLTDQGTLEIWPLVFEKAFGQYMNTVNPYEMFKDNPYGQLAWAGTPLLALEALTGRPVGVDGLKDLSQMGISKPIYLGPPPKDFDQLLSDFESGKAISVFSGKAPSVVDGLVPEHYYAVSKVYQDADGNRWVELYNPWGYNQPPRLPFDQLQRQAMFTA
jgi:hypothetical protein